MIGVALACYGDLEFSALGFFVTALLVVMAAVKVVISGHALTGEWKLHPVDLLSRSGNGPADDQEKHVLNACRSLRLTRLKLI
jgi:hypothetical protein